MPGANSIDGLNSGLKTGEIIDSIMKFERRNAVMLEQQQSEKTNAISAYKAIQAKLLALSTELSRLSRPSTFDATKINVSDSSILSATASGKVITGSYDVQVLALARNDQLASQGFSDESIALLGTGNITLALGNGSSKTITVDSTNNSLIGIKKAINDANTGVVASIINDGSSSNPYRLILTGEKSGIDQNITVTSSLTGGVNLNYSTANFDSPELISMNSGSSSTISLGTTASYSGSENKIYTFTVKGTGAQTLGTDNITIDWTDGTNSGSLVVTQADTEVVLVGTGSDGLKLNFSAGVLTEGDTFQVGTFDPILQEASDARIAIGSVLGGGSPITITSSSNIFDDVVSGLSLTVSKQTAPGDTVSINTSLDSAAIKSSIETFIKRYNEVVDIIETQGSYDAETDTAGILMGDTTLQTMRYSISNVLGSSISGIKGKYTSLYSLGIRTKGDGRLSITDNSRLSDALNNNLDEVANLFSSSGSSSTALIEFISSTTETVAGTDYNVNITQAATRGKLLASDINDPASVPITLDSTNNKMKLTVDGLISNEISLTQKTYNSSSELVAEIQAKIDADDKIGSRGVTVGWITTPTGGQIEITSNIYGSSSYIERDTSISNSVYSSIGFNDPNMTKGKDVAGTINGEEAEGAGLLLSGLKDNKTTAGLVLKITMSEQDVSSSVGGTITVTKGVASKMNDLVGSLTKAGEGALDRKIISVQNQVKTMGQRVKEIDERLALRRESLFKKFYDMELALGQLNATGDFLAVQLKSLSSNWNFGRNRN